VKRTSESVTAIGMLYCGNYFSRNRSSS